MKKTTRKNLSKKNNEKVANDLWREHEALEANFLFIGAFNELKKGNYRQAWVDFEKCEIKCKFLEENSDDDFLSRKRIKKHCLGPIKHGRQELITSPLRTLAVVMRSIIYNWFS